MTERVLGPTGSRSRTTRASLLLMALIGLVFGVLIGGGGIGSAASGPGVDDYSQCTDGTVDGPTPPAFLGCTGWINGILNTNNSTYHEDQVTPQRLVVSNLAAGDHTFHLRYLVRKANNHAYDSLATWNHTQTAATRCLGFAGKALSDCNAATGAGATLSTTPIPADPLVVDSSCNSPTGSPNNITSNHQLPNQEFQMFGGTLATLTAADYKGTSSDSEGMYQSIDVRFSTSGAKSTVYFYFGGHLAAGANTGNPSSPRGWGTGCGAGGISGGPYHIKLDGLDSESIGNRDNQIMSGAVLLLPPISPTLTTTPDADVTWTATLNDTLNVGVGDAGGTATFHLYDNLTACQSDTAGTNRVFDSGTRTVSSGTATSGDFSPNPLPTAQTQYWWYVSYAGDPNHSPPVLGGTSVCTETSTITPPGATSSP